MSQKSTPLSQLQKPQADPENINNIQKMPDFQFTEAFQASMPPPVPMFSPPAFPMMNDGGNQFAFDDKASEQNEVSNNMFADMFNSADIQSTILCVAVFIIVSFLPIEQYVFKYIALDKIPYSAVIVKALIAGALFYVVKRLI